MITRKVHNVMTRKVVTVTAPTPFVEIVRLMALYKVSALPVVGDDGALIGIVSEADLLRKEQYQDDPDGQPRFKWRRHRIERAKAAALTAAELMSAPVVTVSPDATVPVAAKLLAKHSVKRLPVVDEQGRLVGIVSRADLLGLYLRDDDAIRREVLDQVFLQGLWVDPATVTVMVSDGVVTLAGQMERKSLVPMAMHLTRSVPGVVDVVSKLTFDWDDDRPEPVHARSWVP